MTRVTIVVPCYNEAHRLPRQTFLDFIVASDGVTFVFVDDGSQDATLTALEEISRAHPNRVHVLRQERNAGKGEAVRQGLLHALRRNESDLIGFWDADLATPLDAVFDLRQVLIDRPDIQMVFGSRVRLLGREVQRRAIRHYLGRVFATVVSVLLRLPIYDTQCGAKLFRVTPELQRVLGDPFCSRWVFDVELLARFIQLHKGNVEVVRRAVYEYPLHVWNDVAGSKVRPTDFLRAFRDVMKINRRYLTSANREWPHRSSTED